MTLMIRKLEASGHVRRGPAPNDRRATVVELTEGGAALVERVREVWCALAEETVAGLDASIVSALPGALAIMTGNADARFSSR